jgi:Icc-related predicted phosphoesterase
MNWKQWTECIKAYEEAKPEIVISHDCPRIVRAEMWDIHNKTVTSEGLQACLEVHQPDMWFFGHHHYSKTDVIENVLFQCLEELETYKL